MPHQTARKQNYSKIIKAGIYSTYLPKRANGTIQNANESPAPESCPFTSSRLSQIKLDQLQFSHLENKNDKMYPRESLWGQNEANCPTCCVLHSRFTAADDNLRADCVNTTRHFTLKSLSVLKTLWGRCTISPISRWRNRGIEACQWPAQ